MVVGLIVFVYPRTAWCVIAGVVRRRVPALVRSSIREGSLSGFWIEVTGAQPAPLTADVGPWPGFVQHFNRIH